MADTSVLSRFTKLPTRNHATALFVGVKGTGKHRVASAVIECNTDFSLQIRTATLLPLPTDVDNSRPRIDFVVFFVDLRNKLSLEVVKSSVKHLDVDYFLGHCCFVVTNVRNEAVHTVNIQDVMSLADTYDSPLICAELESKQEQGYLARRLLHYLLAVCGLHEDVSPLLMDATKKSFTLKDEHSPAIE